MLFDPAVTGIEEQPVRILYGDRNGTTRHYTPDFLVRRADRTPILVEVKPQKFLTPDLDDKFDAARRYARRRRWTFEIWTEAQIRTPRLENAKFLLPYKDREPPADACKRLLSALAGAARTVSDLVGTTSRDDHERGEALFVLWHLIATRAIAANMDEPLTPESIVQLGGGELP